MNMQKIIRLILNTFLSIFESCFPIQTATLKFVNNDWITKEIRISCRRKNSLYVLNRSMPLGGSR